MKSPTRLLFDIVVLVIIAAGASQIIGLIPKEEQGTYLEGAPKVSNLPDTSEPYSAGLKAYNPQKASSGFTLYPVVGTAEMHLVNMTGKVVHKWGLDAMRARLLPNCNVLVIHGSKWGASEAPWKGLKKKAREYDWDGRLVWEYDAPDRVHHDIQRLENGNTIFPIKTIIPDEYKSKITSKKRQEVEIRSDEILEVDSSGKIVWSWAAHEHLDINSCGKPDCSQVYPSDWTHVNTTSIVPENQWFDEGDERFRPGNIIMIPRNWWTTLIIDKSTKKPVWEYIGDYQGGLSGGHEAHMIPKGLPGAGNILIFDNGRVLHKGKSFILEVNPTTNELVWVYDAGKNFYSNSAGSMQRLSNGNTFISEDLEGRIFEVTPENEIVWEYDSNYRIARAQRYDYGYCEKFEELSKF